MDWTVLRSLVPFICPWRKRIHFLAAEQMVDTVVDHRRRRACRHHHAMPCSSQIGLGGQRGSSLLSSPLRCSPSSRTPAAVNITRLRERHHKHNRRRGFDPEKSNFLGAARTCPMRNCFREAMDTNEMMGSMAGRPTPRPADLVGRALTKFRASSSVASSTHASRVLSIWRTHKSTVLRRLLPI